MQTATTEQPEKLLTPLEVAELLRLTRRRVYQLINEGEFGEIVRLGPQSLRITATAYAAYIRRNRVAS